MQRKLKIDGIQNIRDLGGHPTRTGRRTRWKTFVRGDHVEDWTEHTRQGLADYGVSLVIDLRMPEETQGKPSGFEQSPRIRYLNLPLLLHAQTSSERYQVIDRTRRDNAELYLYMLDECQAQIGRILTAMAEHEAGTTLFHCFIGRDRTGVIAALLLGLVDTEHEAIVADYALTAEQLGSVLAKWRADALAGGTDEERAQLWTAAHPRSMQLTLQHLHERHGGCEAYVRSCGVSAAAIARLRARLLE